MRRTALLLALVLLSAGVALPASAHRGHPGPRITRFEFVATPFKAGALERLVIVAHDPDSWISEIQVQWEDADQSGGVIFAHTYCVQDPEFENPGTRAKLKLDLTFEHAGTYHVEARAISEQRCEGGNDVRTSSAVEQDVTVEDPTQAFTDLDDTDGPLDVLGVTQGVVASEDGIQNHVVHTLTMSDDLGLGPLDGSGDEVELWFDTDADETTYERIVRIDAGLDGALRAEIADASGAILGEATVTTEGATLRVEFGRRLLGTRIEHYLWFAVTHDASDGICTSAAPCTDRAPDEGVYAHAL